jgi:signal transduction histidine kinase
MHQVAIHLDLAPRLPLIAVERVAIEQVVVNLLHNSVEALLHKSAGTREVQIATAANGDGTIEVRVSDNGPGLPAEMVPQIFEPFATSKWNGIGLGLPMSRSIVREHGGELWLVSSTGLGAEFRFSLPVEGVTNRAGS